MDGAAPSAPQCSGSGDGVNQGADAAIPPSGSTAAPLPPGTGRNPLRQREGGREGFLPRPPVCSERDAGTWRG